MELSLKIILIVVFIAVADSQNDTYGRRYDEG